MRSRSYDPRSLLARSLTLGLLPLAAIALIPTATSAQSSRLGIMTQTEVVVGPGKTAEMTMAVINNPTSTGPLENVTVSLLHNDAPFVSAIIVNPFAPQTIGVGDTVVYTVQFDMHEPGPNQSCPGVLVFKIDSTTPNVTNQMPTYEAIEISPPPFIPLLGPPGAVVLAALLLALSLFWLARRRPTLRLAVLIACALLATIGYAGAVLLPTTTELSTKEFFVGTSISSAKPKTPCPTGVTDISVSSETTPPPYGGTYKYTANANLDNNYLREIITVTADNCNTGLMNFTGEAVGPFKHGASTMSDRITTPLPGGTPNPCTVTNTQELQCYNFNTAMWVTFATNTHSVTLGGPAGSKIVTTGVSNPNVNRGQPSTAKQNY